MTITRTCRRIAWMLRSRFGADAHRIARRKQQLAFEAGATKAAAHWGRVHHALLVWGAPRQG